MPKRLLVRADDLGSSSAANKAILDCLRAGVVRSAGLMACTQGVGEAAAALCAGVATPGPWALGFHSCLNAEWAAPWARWGPVLPPSSVPTLVEADGSFTRAPAVLHQRGFSRNEALAELGAQLVKLRTLGAAPFYLDEHMALGWIDGGTGGCLRADINRFASREGLYPAEQAPLTPLPPAVDRTAPLAEQWLESLRQAPAGDYLLITHPAVTDAYMRSLGHDGLQPGAIAAERAAEHAALCTPGLAEAIAGLGVELISYRDLAA